jgi:uncharacterized protein (DUF58 family)
VREPGQSGGNSGDPGKGSAEGFAQDSVKSSAQDSAQGSVRSGPALFIAALLWLGLGAGAYFSGRALFVWALCGIGLLPLAALDAVLLLLFCRRYRVLRELPLVCAQGEPVRALIRVQRERDGLLPAALKIFDLYPPAMDTGAFPARLSRQSLRNEARDGEAVFGYTLIPRERGPWFFPGVELLYTSPLCFWRLKIFREFHSGGRTFPNFRKFGAGLRGIREEQGFQDIRMRGQGLEFRDLREYQEGDPVKSIDWRATARQRTPSGLWRFIVREYQEERDQQVLCVLDTGFRLRRDEFDAALRGTMLLAYTALKHGDAAAVMSFGGMERWVPPRKGPRYFSVIMNQLYDLHSSSAPSSPFFALENALAALRRRTFIVLISNFREEDGVSLSWILPRIRRKHLLLLVSFREAEAERLARRTSAELFPQGKAARSGGPPPKAPGHSLPETSGQSPQDMAWESAAAFSYLAARKRLYQSWEHQGLLTLEASAETFSSALVNRYLDVKRSGKL